MVESYEMIHKNSQQRQGRVDGANRCAADRDAVEEDRALAPETTQASPRQALDREPPGVGRDSLDSADRCSLAGSAGEISASFNLLAALAELLFVNRRGRPYSRNKVVQQVLHPVVDKLGISRKGQRGGRPAATPSRRPGDNSGYLWARSGRRPATSRSREKSDTRLARSTREVTISPG